MLDLGEGLGGEWGHPKDGLVTSTDNVRFGGKGGGGGWGHPKDSLVTSTDNIKFGGRGEWDTSTTV